jgi:hypothetical protein
MQAIQALGRGRERRTDRQLNGRVSKGSNCCSRYPRYPQACYRKFCFRDSEHMCMVTPVIGAEVPVSPESRQRPDGRGRDRRTDLRRQEWEELSGSSRASREEAPEEVSSSSATRLPGFFGTLVSEAGRKSGYPKKGRGTSGGFERELRFSIRPDIERQANLREAQSSRSQGFSSERAVRCKATPELVSQDREAGNQSFRAAGTR